MTEVYPGVWQSPAEHKESRFVESCCYLVQHSEGNWLLHGHNKVGEWINELEQLGGVRHLLLTSRNELSDGLAKVKDHFKATTYCHMWEKDVVTQQLGVDHIIQAQEVLASGLTAIPIPGYAPGALAALWEMEGQQLLFVGESLYCNRGNWQADITYGDRAPMLKSLELLRRMHIDRLFCSLSVGTQKSAYFTQHTWEKTLFAIQERLEMGYFH